MMYATFLIELISLLVSIFCLSQYKKSHRVMYLWLFRLALGIAVVLFISIMLFVALMYSEGERNCLWQIAGLTFALGIAWVIVIFTLLPKDGRWALFLLLSLGAVSLVDSPCLLCAEERAAWRRYEKEAKEVSADKKWNEALILDRAPIIAQQAISDWERYRSAQHPAGKLAGKAAVLFKSRYAGYTLANPMYDLSAISADVLTQKFGEVKSIIVIVSSWEVNSRYGPKWGPLPIALPTPAADGVVITSQVYVVDVISKAVTAYGIFRGPNPPKEVSGSQIFEVRDSIGNRSIYGVTANAEIVRWLNSLPVVPEQ